MKNYDYLRNYDKNIFPLPTDTKDRSKSINVIQKENKPKNQSSLAGHSTTQNLSKR